MNIAGKELDTKGARHATYTGAFLVAKTILSSRLARLWFDSALGPLLIWTATHDRATITDSYSARRSARTDRPSTEFCE